MGVETIETQGEFSYFEGDGVHSNKKSNPELRFLTERAWLVLDQEMPKNIYRFLVKGKEEALTPYNYVKVGNKHVYTVFPESTSEQSIGWEEAEEKRKEAVESCGGHYSYTWDGQPKISYDEIYEDDREKDHDFLNNFALTLHKGR